MSRVQTRWRSFALEGRAVAACANAEGTVALVLVAAEGHIRGVVVPENRRVCEMRCDATQAACCWSRTLGMYCALSDVGSTIVRRIGGGEKEASRECDGAAVGAAATDLYVMILCDGGVSVWDGDRWREKKMSCSAVAALPEDRFAVAREDAVEVFSAKTLTLQSKFEAPGCQMLTALPEGILVGSPGTLRWFDLHVLEAPVPIADMTLDAAITSAGIFGNDSSVLAACQRYDDSEQSRLVVVDFDDDDIWECRQSGDGDAMIAATASGEAVAIARGQELLLASRSGGADHSRRQDDSFFEAETVAARGSHRRQQQNNDTSALVARMYEDCTSKSRSLAEATEAAHRALQRLLSERRITEAAALAASATRAAFEDAPSARKMLSSVAAALERLVGPRNDEASVESRPLRDALVVVLDARDAVDCFDTYIADLASDDDWSTAFAAFRDGDALDYFELAGKADSAKAGRVLWARYLRRRATTGTAEARAAFSWRFADRCAQTREASLAFLATCVFRPEVLATLRGPAVAHLAVLAAQRAREAALSKSDDPGQATDRALRFVDAVLGVLGPRSCSVVDCARGSNADARLTGVLLQDKKHARSDPDVNTTVMVVHEDNKQHIAAAPHPPTLSVGVAALRDLQQRLRRVVELRDRHGASLSTTLADYEATADKSGVATSLLDRVREPRLLGDEIEHHVRPVCESHGLEADDVLLAYCRRAKNPQEEADRYAAVVREIRDEGKRARGALALIEASRPPYPASVLAVLGAFGDTISVFGRVVSDDTADLAGLKKGDAAVFAALADAARLARLGHIAAVAKAKNFEPGDASHAPRLMRLIVRNAAETLPTTRLETHRLSWDQRRDDKNNDHEEDVSAALDILGDVAKLAEAYPATISPRDAVVAFAQDLLSPRSAWSPVAPAAIRLAVIRLVPRGADRQCARRDVLRGCALALDDADCDDDEKRRAATVAAAVGEDLLKENDETAVVLEEEDEYDDDNDEAQRENIDNDLEARNARGLAEADAKLVDTLQRVAALHAEFGLSQVTPLVMRSPERRLCLLQTAAGPVAEAAVATNDAHARATLERLAALLDAPPGWTAAALVAASKDTRYADELWQADGADKGKRAEALRDLAKWQLLRGGADVRGGDDARHRRFAATRALAQAASLEPKAALIAGDATLLEIVRFLGSVADRCVTTTTSSHSSTSSTNDGLLLVANDVAPYLAAFLRDLFEQAGVLLPTRESFATQERTSARHALCALFGDHEAWRLAAEALAVSSSVRASDDDDRALVVCCEKQLRHRLLYFQRDKSPDWLSRRFEAEAVAGLAAATGASKYDTARKRVVLEAYREAVGAVSVSDDLEALGDLARLGAAVATRLEDHRLRDASASLAEDSKWWRLLRKWRVPFDHRRLRVNADDGSAHARDLVCPILDGSPLVEEGPVDPDRVAVVLALCRRYGVPGDIAGAAAAVRVLARGVARSDGGKPLQKAAAAFAKRSLSLVSDASRRVAVLRAAIATADPLAFERIDLAVTLLLEEHRQNPATAAASAKRAVIAKHQDNSRLSERPVFAAPSMAQLERWRQLLRWLRSVRLDAATALGPEGARRLEEKSSFVLSFHGLVAEPAKTLDVVLVESTAPRLARVARLAGLDAGALWIRLAKRRVAEGHINDGWRCLDRAALLNVSSAAEAAKNLLDDDEDGRGEQDLLSRVDLTSKATALAERWATEKPRQSAAHERRHEFECQRRDAARRAVAALFLGGGFKADKSLDAFLSASSPRALLEDLYRRSAARLADDLFLQQEAPSFFEAARRAHRAARLLARFETGDCTAGDDLAEAARRELSRAWIFDDDESGGDNAADAKGDAESVFAPSRIELRERAIAVAAVKIAFVLSARNLDEDTDDDDVDDDIRALEGRLLSPALRQRSRREDDETKSAVELLVELASGPPDESSTSTTLTTFSQNNDVEAGRRERLTAAAKLRALRAASILGAGSSLEAAFSARLDGDDEEEEETESPGTLLALARRLRVVAELGALRLPQARIVAARGAACGIGVHAVVTSLLADHGRDPRMAPTLLPLLAALLLETDDDGLGGACVDDPKLWRRLLDHFRQRALYRPLLAVFARLAHQPWMHTWRGDGLADLFRAAIRSPADELIANDPRHKKRPLWPRNGRSEAQTKHKTLPPLPLDAVVAVFLDALALLRACPHFVRQDDRDHLATGLRTLENRHTDRLADVFQAEATDDDADPDFTTFVTGDAGGTRQRAPRLSI